MQSTQTINVPASLGIPGLRRVLRDWRQLVLDFHDKVRCPPDTAQQYKGRDAAYWYTERANVGILAAAAWRQGVPALEEFNEPKQWRRGKYAGRVDLWLQFPSKRRVDVGVEAKMVWLGLGRDAQPSPKAMKKLSDARVSARNAAAELDATGYEKRIAAIFVVPCCRLDDLKVAKPATIRAVERLRRAVGPSRSFSAYAFLRTRQREELPCWGKKKRNRVFPGVALVGWREDVPRS